MIPKNFKYLDSFVVPDIMEPGRRALNEYITEENRYKYFLQLKNTSKRIDRKIYKAEDFPVNRIVYILVWLSPEDQRHYLKVGMTQHCFQRIGKNYLAGTGANTQWLSPAMYEFLKEKGGEFEIYARSFDVALNKVDDDIAVQYVARLDLIEKHYQDLLDIQDGKKAVNKFFADHNFSYIIK